MGRNLGRVVVAAAAVGTLLCVVPAVLAALLVHGGHAPLRLVTPGHASLVTTDPTQGAVLARPPARVTATFNQPVAIGPSGVQVFTPDGKRADRGATTQPAPDTISVPLVGDVGRGTFTVAWHVISADSHPVQGAFTFSIGNPSPTHVGSGDQSAGSQVVGTLYGVVRGLAYGFFAVLAGVVAFLVVCWPEGAGHRGPQRLAGVGWVGLLASSLLALLLQGPYQEEKGLGDLLSPAVLWDTVHSRIGTAIQLREVLTVLAAVAVLVLLPRLPAAGFRLRTASGAAWAVLVAGIAATWAAYDHSSVGSQVALALPADVVHLAAAGVWIGGLVTLACFVLRRPVAPTAVAAVSRFSAVALGCVATLVATGAYQAWRQVGSWPALVGTGYGRLVLVKIAGMSVLIGLGYLARRYLRRDPQPAPVPAEPVPVLVGIGTGTATSAALGVEPAPAPRPAPAAVPLRRLRRSVTVELGVAAVILAVTAVLVNTPTGRESYSRPTSATVRFTTAGAHTLNAFVTPGKLGANQVDLFLTQPGGRPYVPAEVRASAYLPARDLGPFDVVLNRAGPGRYVDPRALFTVTGQWQLRITVRGDAVDETTVTVPVTVY